MEREEQVSMSVHDYEMTADSDCESSSAVDPRRFNEFSRNGMARLNDSSANKGEFSVIKKCFLAGMGSVREEINVVAVHKNLYSSVAGKAKLEAFRIFSQAAATRRGGDANIKYGWYGGSRDEVIGVVNHGFGGSEMSFSHGIGVHLSPANLPFDSAMRAEEDEHGVRHLLLCRVILGNTETIGAGSEQFQPSSTDFDSGIDNPLSPTKYIIWSSCINTHIFPNYIVSFTAPSLVGRSWNSARKPESPSMKFPVLMNVLSRFLPPPKMDMIKNCYNEFRGNKIGRPQLIRRLRSLVGDNVLISVIKLCKDQRK